VSICYLSYKNSHFHLLLENHWTTFNQIWHKGSPWGPT
jgi:hypothetical protein